MADLSILIPSRQEMFLGKTIENILENIEGNTEIIAVLDGAWADPPIRNDPRVTIIYHNESIGQRAATNEACRLSKAKYVMKVDAHCAFDKGFDVKMMKEMHDDWTMVPLMKNLHAFDWVCEKCKERRYQSPSGPCEKCGGETKRDILWKAKPSPNSTAFRFDKTLHFQYWGDYKKRQIGEIADTMSIQGSCFMITREKYWELDICSEEFNSWGQQGVEVACKTWLSGGRLVVNKKTWYAHMFRTQGGDFGFPYEQSGNAIEKNRQYSRELFKGDTWPKAKHKFQWLIDKFAPIPDWHDEKPVKSNKSIIFYTDNQLNLKIASKVQRQLKKIGLPIVSASLKPMNFGKNVHLPLKRGHLSMFKQILAALGASESEIVFFCEHDVLYHPSHFDFVPSKKDVFYYNLNVWKVDWETKKALKVDKCEQLSGMCVYRELALSFCREKVKQLEADSFDGHFEPRGKRGSWDSKEPLVDIRHSGTLTRNRWSKDQFRNQENTKGWTEGECPDWAKDLF